MHSGVPIQITRKLLEKMYLRKGLSMKAISLELSCSVHRVEYWMKKYGIQRRSISEAIYLKNNPTGDPFNISEAKTLEESYLLGLGLGLYWGEGTKADKYSVRLGNTDPHLIKSFMSFLSKTLGVKKEELKFSLQIFSDINAQEALNFWAKFLDVDPSQFGKTIVTRSGSIGTYSNKSIYGVLTVYFHNKKLRDILIDMLPR